ncbi:hypothetical protein [Candidatus Accumulibacter sp. ACC003]|uniref:hypothetical protein n=1 Tax=Candidatus Accumulibacter sp. ACC003 TaxID=2823334 RepID=UPI0025BA4AAB|nr:hypothetical protein [Candidatus Accumulibacter sp. ACC003]
MVGFSALNQCALSGTAAAGESGTASTRGCACGCGCGLAAGRAGALAGTGKRCGLARRGVEDEAGDGGDGFALVAGVDRADGWGGRCSAGGAAAGGLGVSVASKRAKALRAGGRSFSGTNSATACTISDAAIAQASERVVRQPGSA